MHEPEQYRRYGRLLGELHERLHRLTPPEWLRPATSADERDGDAGDGDVIVHLDLHPGNVILSERGPIVIDWSNAGAGSAAMDAAVTVIITLGSDLDGAFDERIESMRSLLIDAFLETCGTDPRLGLDEAIAYRRGNPNNTPAENHWIDTKASDCLDAFYLQPRAV
jgi:Ser/Thr protein kinase RdoA (MazF antagonist)